MSDQQLRDIRTLLSDVQAHMADTLFRVGMLEDRYASLSLQLDRVAADVERIKRQLDLVEVVEPSP
jgi:hypothetical protein